MNYQELMAQARKTNKERDQDERAVGFQAASDGTPDLQLRTAMSAIECGIKIEDWSCIAEAQAMLEHLHFIVTGKRYES
jgi:hypothetical protein